tara:strand:- start:8796 stop:9776 length:981 start_codon:yes stop_codon:yes gene_type:complete
MAAITELIRSLHSLKKANADCERHLVNNPEDYDAFALYDTSAELIRRKDEEFKRIVSHYRAQPISYEIVNARGGNVLAGPLFRGVEGYENTILIFAQSILENRPQNSLFIHKETRQNGFRYGYLYSDRLDQLGAMLFTGGTDQLDLPIPGLEPSESESVKAIKEAVGEFSKVVSDREKKSLGKVQARFGRACIKGMLEWAQATSAAEVDVLSEFGSGNDLVRFSSSVFHSETLASSISRYSADTQIDHKELTGEIEAFNQSTSYFAFRDEDGVKYSGKVPKDLFTVEAPVMLPSRYKVVLRETRRVNDLTEDITLSYRLVSADPIL